MNIQTIFEVSALIIMLLTIIPLVASEEGTLLVENGSIMSIDNSKLILTGNITVNDDSTLSVENSQIQLSIRGEETYYSSISGDGVLMMKNSSLETLSSSSLIQLSDNSLMTLQGSNITGFNNCRGY